LLPAECPGLVEFKSATVIFESAHLGDHGEREADFFEGAARRCGSGVGALADRVEGGRIEGIGVGGGEGGMGVGGVNHLLALLEEERGAKAVPKLGEPGEAFDFDAEIGSDEDAGIAVGHAVEEHLDEFFALIRG